MLREWPRLYPHLALTLSLSLFLSLSLSLSLRSYPLSRSRSRSRSLTVTRPRRQVHHVHDVERGRHLDTRRGPRCAQACSAAQLRDRATPVLVDRSGRVCRHEGRCLRPARPKRPMGRGGPEFRVWRGLCAERGPGRAACLGRGEQTPCLGRAALGRRLSTTLSPSCSRSSCRLSSAGARAATTSSTSSPSAATASARVERQPSSTPRPPARPALQHAPPAPEPAQGGLQPRPASASLGQSVTGAAPAGHAGPVLTTTCERASFLLTLAPTPTLPPTRHQGQVRPSRSHAEPVPATEAQETEVAAGGRRLHADR